MKRAKKTILPISMVTAILLIAGCDLNKPQETTTTEEQVAPAVAPSEQSPAVMKTRPAFAIFSLEKGTIDLLFKPESAPADMSFENSCPAGTQPLGLADINFGGKLYCTDASSRSIRVMDLATKAELFTWMWPSEIQGTPMWFIGRWKKDTDVGLAAYDSARGVFHIFDSADKSFKLSSSFEYGGVGTQLLPLVGDWNGDGSDSIGVYKPATSQMDLRNSLDAGIADISFRFENGSAEPQDVAIAVNTEQRTVAGLYSATKGSATLGSTDLAVQPQTVFFFGAPEQQKIVVPVR
ncbi:MAG: hypothetical protein ABI644_12975 [Arenimonas sp.]